MSIKTRSDAELHGHYTPDDGPSQGGGGRAPQEGGGLRPKPPGVLMLPRWRTPHQRGPAQGNDGACRIVYRFLYHSPMQGQPSPFLTGGSYDVTCMGGQGAGGFLRGVTCSVQPSPR